MYRALGGFYDAPKLKLGNIDAVRDWGHARDYVEAMWLMLQQEVPDDYVIATGQTHSIRDFLSVAFSYVGINDWENFVVVDPKFYRPAEVDVLRGDSSKALKKLNWASKTTFKDMVIKMISNDIKILS